MYEVSFFVFRISFDFHILPVHTIVHCYFSASLISKFTNLKTVYQRNRKKLLSLPSGSGSAGFTLPWVHFERMRFLEDVESVEPSTSNLDTSFANSQVITFIVDSLI